MFEVKQGNHPSMQDAIKQMRADGYYVDTRTMDDIEDCLRAVNDALQTAQAQGQANLDVSTLKKIEALIAQGLIPAGTKYAEALNSADLGSLSALLSTAQITSSQNPVYAEILADHMLTQGIKAVAAQDANLAALMAQMEKQTQTLVDINDCMQGVNNELAQQASGTPRTETLTEEQLIAATAYSNYAKALLDKVNELAGKLPDTNAMDDLKALLQPIIAAGDPAHSPRAAELLQAAEKYNGATVLTSPTYLISLNRTLGSFVAYFSNAAQAPSSPIDQDGARGIWTATWLFETCNDAVSRLGGGTPVLPGRQGIDPNHQKIVSDAGLNTQDMVNRLRPAGTLDSATQDKIKALMDAGLLAKDTVYQGALTREQLETLQKNLSTAQSSQGALNEDMSLKLNEAASKRSAIFTQLQTMLQTIMQTRQALARW